MLDLTFPYISFAKKFCQKKVKKNCKYVARVFFENTDMRRKKRHGKLANVLRGWFIGRGDADLSLRDKMRCDGQRLTLQTVLHVFYCCRTGRSATGPDFLRSDTKRKRLRKSRFHVTRHHPRASPFFYFENFLSKFFTAGMYKYAVLRR